MCSGGRAPKVSGVAEESTTAYVSEDRIDEVAVPEAEESSLQVGDKAEVEDKGQVREVTEGLGGA